MFCMYILHFHSKILVSIQVYDIDLYHTISPSRIQEAEIHLTHTTQHFHTLPTKVNKGTHITLQFATTYTPQLASSGKYATSPYLD